ncbi:hypothetical protein OROGR_029864 [Orobanche gracilis]
MIPTLTISWSAFFVGKFSKESLYMHSPQPKFSCGYTINNVSSACYLQENTMPSLRKALKDVAMEKDVAVVARGPLCPAPHTKKRMKEAEEEQYRAEEDAAALRAELNSLQHAMHNLPCSIATIGYSVDQIQAMEKELSNLTSKLEKCVERITNETARASTLNGGTGTYICPYYSETRARRKTCIYL